MHLVMGESNLSRLQEPCALFEFNLAAPASSAGPTALASSAGSISEEALALEFTHAELFDLFNKLERVQEQLDGLS